MTLRKRVEINDVDSLVEFFDRNSTSRFFKKNLNDAIKSNDLKKLLDDAIFWGRISCRMEFVSGYKKYAVYSSNKYVSPELRHNEFKNVFNRKEYKPNTATQNIMERVNKERDEYKARSVNLD